MSVSLAKKVSLSKRTRVARVGSLVSRRGPGGSMLYTVEALDTLGAGVDGSPVVCAELRMHEAERNGSRRLVGWTNTDNLVLVKH